MQINIGAKNGNTYQIEVENPTTVIGKKVGEEVEGDNFDLPGYTLEITGGSDKQGFPMRENIEGTERRKVLIEEGPGIQSEREGVKHRKSVRGNTVSDEIQQLNVRVVEEGNQDIEEILNEEEEE